MLKYLIIAIIAILMILSVYLDFKFRKDLISNSDDTEDPNDAKDSDVCSNNSIFFGVCSKGIKRKHDKH